jgi:hypothetical protein
MNSKKENLMFLKEQGRTLKLRKEIVVLWGIKVVILYGLHFREIRRGFWSKDIY